MTNPTPPTDVLTHYVNAPHAERLKLYRGVMKSLVAYAETQPVEALLWLSQQYDPTWDFSQQQQAYQTYRRLREKLDATEAVSQSIAEGKTLAQQRKQQPSS